MKALPWVLGAIILILLGVLIFIPGNRGDNGQPNSTSTPGGNTPVTSTPTSTQDLYSYATAKGKIVRSYIASNQNIASPVRVEGNVPPGWAFEGSFPIRITDASGKVLATAIAAAPNWMSTTTVWYAATITFAKPTSTTGFIVFVRDNASGLPEHDDSARIPVRF